MGVLKKWKVNTLFERWKKRHTFVDDVNIITKLLLGIALFFFIIFIHNFDFMIYIVILMFMFLLLLPLEKVFKLSSYYLFNWFFIVYNVGVIITVGMMLTKGTYQVTGKSFSPEAFAGFAGIGHTGMLAGLLLLFFLLRQAILKEPRD